MDFVSGFSKMSRREKISWLSEAFGREERSLARLFSSFLHSDEKCQKAFSEFSENTLTNFFLPFGIAPNFLINDKLYAVPMVTEESSVVAAASRAGKFWASHGGVKAHVQEMTKVGQVHFFWKGEGEIMGRLFEQWKPSLLEELRAVTASMERRGGGVKELVLLDKTQELPHYYQIFGEFDTCDAMGANFINSALELLGRNFARRVNHCQELPASEREVEITMCILSNYTPRCLAHVQVNCPLSVFDEGFLVKFKRAVDIAQVDPYRAVTHNKGIFNGIDAVVLATGNDFRAVESCGHAYASLGGSVGQGEGGYRGLTRCDLENDQFIFSLELPLALGTVGGMTSLHPIAEFSLDILGRPSSKELMMVAASVGLVQNFAALENLVTMGIQRGHMKMHLFNILRSLHATDGEREEVQAYFRDKTICFSDVKNFLETLRTRRS